MFKAHRLVYPSTLGCRVIKKRKKVVLGRECFRFTKRFCFTKPGVSFYFTNSAEELHCWAQVVLGTRAT